MNLLTVPKSVGTTVTQPEPAPVTSFKDKTPSSWSITATEDGITARSNSTGETFEGSIADFNERLRG